MGVFRRWFDTWRGSPRLSHPDSSPSGEFPFWLSWGGLEGWDRWLTNEVVQNPAL